MTVRRADGGWIELEGPCPVEEAETLLRLLQETPGAVVDWRGCATLHTAVAQLLLQFRPPMRGPCGDAFLRSWITPLLPSAREEGTA